jgi:enhancing lycopene biosynthesis protein 2
MGKRAAVVLSGCGDGDGSELRESVLTLLSLERAGADVMCFAPDVPQTLIHDHFKGAADDGAPSRQVLSEAARIARGRIRPLASLGDGDFDVLIFPGGQGVGTVLSNYADKAERCEVLPDVARLLKAALAKHRPIGVVGLAPILAARVLGPVAGVHLTVGARGTAVAKHAAVMGADVRPGQATDVFVDRKNRVVSTPAYLYDDIRLTEVAHAIERLVRTVMQLSRGEKVSAVIPATPPGSASAPRSERGRSPGASAPPASVPAPPPRPRTGAPVLRRPGPTRGPGSA